MLARGRGLIALGTKGGRKGKEYKKINIYF